MNRRKSTLGRPRATPLSPPVRMLMVNSSRRSPRLGTLGWDMSSVQKSGQKSSSKKVRLFDRLRESHAPSQMKQPQQINYETNHVSKIAPKKSVSRRLDMKPEESEPLLGASNKVGVEDITLVPPTPTNPSQLQTVSSASKSKRKSLPKKVVHNLRTRAISNNMRKPMSTGIPQPKYHSSKKKEETKPTLPRRYPCHKKMQEQERKFPLPKLQPPLNCSMDSTARFERDEAFVVTSTPAIQAITPFGAIKTLVEGQTPKRERVDTETGTFRDVKNSISEALQKQNQLLERQNQILEKILQEQSAQTEIMKSLEINTGRKTHHEAGSHPLSPAKLRPSENIPRRIGTPVGKENSKLSAMKARKSLPSFMSQTTIGLGIPTPNIAKATPRTKNMYRRAQEQLNLLCDT